MRSRLLKTALALCCATFLAACQIDSQTAMRAYDIQNVAQTGAPVGVRAMITGVFIGKHGCTDEGAMVVAGLTSAAVPIRALGCKASGGQAIGTFELDTNLVRTAGAHNPATAVGEVLGDDLVRFAVFPHGKHKGLLSVGVFLNVAKLEAAKAQFAQMPVFKEDNYDGTVPMTLTVAITNDLPNMAKFYLTDVSAGGDLPSDEAVMQIPPGGSDTVTLDTVTMNKLVQGGYVNFFAMAAQ